MVLSLHIFLAILAASATLHFQATASLDWTSSPSDGATVLACVGQEVILEWNFIAEAGDQVRDIRWYVADNTSQQLMATLIDGNFFSVPHFSGGLRHLGQAMLALDHVTAKDKASYSVEVDMHLSSGMYDTEQKSVQLVVAPPLTSSGELAVSQNRHADYDNVTGLWHVTLTCGMFTELGQPHVDVIWKTPSGSSLPSSNYDNGYFELLLDNPVEGGNYFCRLNPSSPAAACFQDDDPIMKEVKVTVDEVKARLTLMEANQGALQSELRAMIQQQQTNKNKNANLTDQLHSLETQHHNLTNYVDNLQAEFSHFHEAASARVSFYARLSSVVQVSEPNPVIMTQVYNNEGGAYSNTTGQFTVPRNGTYSFFASVGTNSGAASVYIMMDNTDVCWTHSYFSGNVQGSTCHAVLHLVKGQRVWLKTYGTSNYWSPGTVFSGFLLNADE